MPSLAPDSALQRLQALADQCVMCGLCLPVCPTYARDRVEARGPRGRIALIQAIATSTDWLTPAAAADLDSCLSCLRCQQACPAQVRYGELIDQARQRWRAPSRATRAWLWLAARPRLLTALTKVGRGLRGVWPLSLLRGLEPAPERRLPAPIDPATAVVAYVLSGCSARALEPAALDALLQLGQLAGLRLQVLDSGCCGALQRHAGQTAQAQLLAKQHWQSGAARTGDNPPPLLGWASGCQQQLNETAPAQVTTESVLTWAARVLLSRLPPMAAEFARIERPGLWIPCTLPTQAGGAGVLERLLQHECGDHWHKLDALGCCGAAGIRHLGNLAADHRLSDAVLDAALAQGCTLLLSANPGCLLALRTRSAQRRLRLPVLHVFDWMLQRRHAQSSSIEALPATGD